MLQKLLIAALAVCAPLGTAQAETAALWTHPDASAGAVPPFEVVQNAPSPSVPQDSAYVTSDATASFARSEGPWYKMPNLLGFSVGYYDVDRNTPRKQAVDFRVEHRWGVSLLPKVSDFFNGWDPYFQARPMAGLESTSDGALYGYGGFVFDIFIGEHFFLSPNEVVGAYYRGNGKRLGSFVEFRSTFEGGYRFDNNMRITASFGHISNAGLTQHNPGTEILSGNVYIPVNWVFGD